jgi:hypothetical protein
MNKNLNALKDNLVWTYCTHAFQDSNEISCEMEMYMHQHTFQQSLCKTQYFLPLSVPQTGGRQAVLSFTHRHRIHYEERNQSVYRAGVVFTLWWLPDQEGRILASRQHDDWQMRQTSRGMTSTSTNLFFLTGLSIGAHWEYWIIGLGGKKVLFTKSVANHLTNHNHFPTAVIPASKLPSITLRPNQK